MVVEVRANTLPNKRERFEVPEKVMALSLKKLVGAPKEAWTFENLPPHEVDKKCTCFHCKFMNNKEVKNSRIGEIPGWTWRCHQARNAHLHPQEGVVYVIGMPDEIEHEILKFGMKRDAGDRYYMLWALSVFTDMAGVRVKVEKND